MKCPSCGKEIPDDVDICPHCTASIKHRINIKAIYVIALSLIILASAYGVLAYFGGEVSVTKIRDLGLTDNYNFIRIHGKVVGYPWVYENEYQVTSFRFKVDDGTGTITVKMYGNVIERMVETKKIPAMGDTVDIKGTYMYSSNSLVLNDINYLTISREESRELSLDNVVKAAPWDYSTGEDVNVAGNITGVREFSFGFICTLDGKFDILIPRAYYSLHILNLSELGSGYVRVFGSLQWYQPKAPSDTYKVVSVPHLMKNPEKYNGTYVHILWAQVVERDMDNNTIVVSSNGSSVGVYVRHGVKYYVPGDHVEIQGRFVNYRGTWEISVTRSSDFVSEPKWELIGSPHFKIIKRKAYESNASLNEFSFREVRGVVADYRVFSYSVSITLWSDNVSYVVYVENKAMIPSINYGDKLLVRGIVAYYNGQPEINVRPFTNDVVEVIG